MHEFVKNDPVKYLFYPDEPPILWVKYILAYYFQLAYTNRFNTDHMLGGNEIDSRYLLFRFYFQQDDIFRIVVSYDDLAQ